MQSQPASSQVSAVVDPGDLHAPRDLPAPGDLSALIDDPVATSSGSTTIENDTDNVFESEVGTQSLENNIEGWVLNLKKK